MDELQLISQQQPGWISLENFEETRDLLASALARYESVTYTDSTVEEAKEDKRELTRLRKGLDDRRKEVKRAYLEPYNAFESQVKELLAMIDAPLEEVKAFLAMIEEREKAAKRLEIEGYFWKQSRVLGSMAGPVLSSPAFFDEKWLNKTTSAKTWQAAVDMKIADTARSLANIRTAGGLQAGALTAKFLETMDMADLTDYRDRLTAVDQAEVPVGEPDAGEDKRVGFRVFKLTGTAEQMARAAELMALAGVEYEEVEDGMPQPMPELEKPDFTTFVAFHVETTGTYGAAGGDAPAEITDIGAVKVVDGQIVERFSELVDPGRPIVPFVSELTQITDEMVKGKPKISEVVVRFAEFAGGLPLVGHNVRSSALYYLDRAARRAGVRMENGFFDTCRCAKTKKEAQGWENVKLEYLSQQLGLEQTEPCRALGDAEASAGIYLRLREM